MTTDSMKISLIIPCYNVDEVLINRAVDSVDNQNFEDYEVIIVDDGSNDQYHRILEGIVAIHDKFKLITVTNGGVSRARNIGVTYACGTYIAFLDGDDTLESSFFEKAIYIAEKENADFVIGGLALINVMDNQTAENHMDGNEDYEVFTGQCVTELKKYFIGKESLIKFSAGHIGRGPVSRLIKSHIMKSVQFPENVHIGEDLIWNLKMLSVCKKVIISRQRWYWYWQNQNSVTHGYNSEIYQEWMQQFAELDKYIDLGDNSIYGPYVERLYEGMYQVWDCYLRYGETGNETIKQKIYNDKPWVYFRDSRVSVCCGSKKIIFFSKLYKWHLLFSFFDFRRKIGK